MVSVVWLVDLVLAGAAGALVAGLLFVYGRQVRAAPTPFGWGLVIFGVFLLLQNLVALPVYWLWAQEYGPELSLPLMGIHGAQVVGLLALVWITWE